MGSIIKKLQVQQLPETPALHGKEDVLSPLWADLEVTSNFSFLRGASHPEELVERAAALGYTHIAITDHNTLAGIVRAYSASLKCNIRLIVGCRINLLDGAPLLVYPENIEGYSQLCQLLTVGNLRAEKGKCHLYKKDVLVHLQYVQAIALPPQRLSQLIQPGNAFSKDVEEYKNYFGSRLHIALQRRYLGDDHKLLYCIRQIAQQQNVPLVVTNDVHYHIAQRRQLQDVLTCIREKCTIHNAGFRLYQNAERYLKTKQETKRLFFQYPEAVQRIQNIIEACRFSLSELKYEYPEELTTDGRTPQQELEYHLWVGVQEHFGDEPPKAILDTIAKELQFIEKMNYAAYFLTVFDIVRYARNKGILCQGRGSAANSVVCFCLGITSVNPTKFDLLFERFLSEARNEPPDIDVDFEHERREEVMQYIYSKYGRDRAAIVATVTQQHQKGAIRDVAKAMGLSLDTINKIAGSVCSYGNVQYNDEEKTKELGMNPNDAYLKKVFELTNQFMGFPRQLGQHTGGFVISQHPLSKLCPVINARMKDRTNIEWNKDDIEVLKFLKVDVLALGMLTCIRKAFDLAKQHYALHCTLANIPQDDEATYQMIQRADTIGVFQIESRAQMSMLPRLKPKNFYDLVIEVAIVRPGPIQGDMVHPYLRRRNGEEKVDYPSQELYDILNKTLGVPLFQEQAMKVAIVAAGFTPTEADELRRSMATFKAKGKVSALEHKLIDGMMRNGYAKEYAERVFRQLEGFGSYGFPESHAASFAQLVYVSAWIKCHYPDVFACALLNSLPMGFYQPAQIVIDAEKHGVQVLAVDINFSQWDNILTEKSGKYFSIRLGFRQIKGMKQEDAEMLISARKTAFTDLFELYNAGLTDAALETLADADAFRSIGLDRRQALWHISIKDKPTGMYKYQRQHDDKEVNPQLPLMPEAEHVLYDYASTALSVKRHPLYFLREKLLALGVVTADKLASAKNGQTIKVAGLPLIRQRPETAKGVWFITLEDETGIMNCVAFRQMNELYRKEIVQSRLLMVEGKVQIEGLVIHIIVSKCYNITKMLGSLRTSDMRGDSLKFPKPPTHESKSVQSVFHKGRNFH